MTLATPVFFGSLLADPPHRGEPLPPYPWLKQEALHPSPCGNGPFPPLVHPEIPLLPPPPPPARAFAVGGREPAVPDFAAEPAGRMGVPTGTLPVPGEQEPLPQGGCPMAAVNPSIPSLLISPHMLPRKSA